MNKELLKNLPQVNVLLNKEEIVSLCEKFPRDLVTYCIRDVINDLRANILNDKLDKIDENEIILKVKNKVEKKSKASLKKVINATGTVLHTNFGRAVISRSAAEAILDVAYNYSNLEYDLKAGSRGDRQSHIEKIISEVLGCEAAIVVNNNAAATMLCLAAMAPGKEVIISRGELIEIGGSFRIPDVMEWSNAKLKEIGTTNKTHLKDYKEAFDKDKTAAIMKVHTSNYKIVGFTEDVSLSDLVKFGNEVNTPVIYDMGNGLMTDLHEYGVDEPNIPALLKEGADVVLFSGDKLLGGPQAGIIVGKEKYISMMKKHPLHRAFRVDKYTIAALTATLFEYYDIKEAKKKIPVLKMITEKKEVLKERAEKIKSRLIGNAEFAIEETKDQIGGGTTPNFYIDGYAVTIKVKSVDKLERDMRNIPVPIVGHIKDDKLYLNVRTIFDEDIDTLVDEICKILS